MHISVYSGFAFSAHVKHVVAVCRSNVISLIISFILTLFIVTLFILYAKAYYHTSMKQNTQTYTRLDGNASTTEKVSPVQPEWWNTTGPHHIVSFVHLAIVLVTLVVHATVLSGYSEAYVICPACT